MLNQIVLVGRLVAEPIEIKEEEKTKLKITLAIPRSFKNTNGEYDTDFIDCILWASIAQNVLEYCHKGDLLGVKGRVQSEKIDDKNITNVIAEKVTFLTSKKSEEKEDN